MKTLHRIALYLLFSLTRPCDVPLYASTWKFALTATFLVAKCFSSTGYYPKESDIFPVNDSIFPFSTLSDSSLTLTETIYDNTFSQEVDAPIGMNTIKKQRVYTFDTLAMPLHQYFYSRLNLSLVFSTPKGLPRFGSLDNGSLIFRPKNWDGNNYTITVRATDTEQNSAQQMFYLHVIESINSAPVVIALSSVSVTLMITVGCCYFAYRLNKKEKENSKTIQNKAYRPLRPSLDV